MTIVQTITSILSLWSRICPWCGQTTIDWRFVTISISMFGCIRDVMFATGEGIVYVFWTCVWVVVDMEVSHLELCDTFYDKLINMLYPLVLFVGPEQIFLCQQWWHYFDLSRCRWPWSGCRFGLMFRYVSRRDVHYRCTTLLSHICSTLLMRHTLELTWYHEDPKHGSTTQIHSRVTSDSIHNVDEDTNTWVLYPTACSM